MELAIAFVVFIASMIAAIALDLSMVWALLVGLVAFLFRSRGQLANINTPNSFCQELFSSFFNFLWLVISFAPLSRTA